MTLRNEAGMALLLAIALATILGVLGALLAVTAQTEIAIAGRTAQGRQLNYAVEGALSYAVADLGNADWNAVLAGATSPWSEGDSRPATSMTAAVQRALAAGRSWGGDTPRWTLYLWGPVSSWLPDPAIRVPFYAAVWVADDPSDGDGDPSADTNGVMAVVAVALGPGGGRRAARAVVARPLDGTGNPLPTGVRLLSWSETRW